MPLFISHSIDNAPTADSEAFALLRRRLPDDVYVWHASALELADDEAIPFLLVGEDAGAVLSARMKVKSANNDVH